MAPGAVVGAGVTVGAGTTIAAGAVIEDGTSIGAGCTIEATAVLGKFPRLRPGSAAAGAAPGALRVEDGATICAGAVVYAGASIGRGAIVGDQSQVREGARIGAGSVVGRGSCIDFGASLGERVVIQTGVYLTGGALVEDDVFVGPGVQTTNDNTMTRRDARTPLLGPVLRRACRIGGGVVLVPGVEVGEEAYVAAGAVVTRDVAPRQVVIGAPARVVREVPSDDLVERWR